MPTGLLTNQIGYDSQHRIRFIFRSEMLLKLDSGATWVITTTDGLPVADGNWASWGKLWNEYWWVAELTSLAVGNYQLSTHDSEGRLWQEWIEVGSKPYFTKAFEAVALDQFERRSMISTVSGKGWIDCGSYLSEANSHAVSVIGMCKFYLKRRNELEAGQIERLVRQIQVGCKYFLFLSEEAIRLGLPKGTYQHEPVNKTVWLLEDSLQVGQALCLAVQVFRLAGDTDFARQLLQNAETNYDFLSKDPDTLVKRMVSGLPPCSLSEDVELSHFSARTHALPSETPLPTVWMTRELLLYLQFQLLLTELTGSDLEAEMFAVAEEILSRRIENEKSNSEMISGCFLPFPGVDQAEVACCHHSVGRDTGGVFPHFVIPLWELSQRYPSNPLSETCRTAVDDFIKGYLKPFASASPFSLLPNTWKHGEGWLFFAGLWHGINASYALMAMQCFYFAEQLDLPWLHELGKAQMDWIAGLNAGLTLESQYGSLMSEQDVASGEAVPVSMIYGVGKRFAGSWRTIRGSICNGFSRGRQFHFDIEPLTLEDRPDSFTDEDWITHSGAWLAALAHCDL